MFSYTGTNKSSKINQNRSTSINNCTVHTTKMYWKHFFLQLLPFVLKPLRYNFFVFDWYHKSSSSPEKQYNKQNIEHWKLISMFIHIFKRFHWLYSLWSFTCGFKIHNKQTFTVLLLWKKHQLNSSNNIIVFTDKTNRKISAWDVSLHNITFQNSLFLYKGNLQKINTN